MRTILRLTEFALGERVETPRDTLSTVPRLSGVLAAACDALVERAMAGGGAVGCAGMVGRDTVLCGVLQARAGGPIERRELPLFFSRSVWVNE